MARFHVITDPFNHFVQIPLNGANKAPTLATSSPCRFYPRRAYDEVLMQRLHT